jgi:hypothetical protein
MFMWLHLVASTWSKRNALTALHTQSTWEHQQARGRMIVVHIDVYVTLPVSGGGGRALACYSTGASHKGRRSVLSAHARDEHSSPSKTALHHCRHNTSSLKLALLATPQARER